MARELDKFDEPYRLCIALAMVNSILDQKGVLRGVILHTFIETLKADHLGEIVDL